MKTIDALNDLAADELRRIRQTLFVRYGVGVRGNIVEVGFGVAEVAGQIDRQRPDAICFYVTRKRTPHSKADRIPDRIDVRVKRGSHFVLVQLPSDVVEIDRQAVQLSGRCVRHVSGQSFATAGAIVAWRFATQGRFAYGVLTVGHLFWNRTMVPERADDVRVRVGGNRQILGRLILRSLPGDGVDAAIVLSSRRALVEGGVLREGASIRGKKIRTVEQLTADRLRRGWTLPRSAAMPLVVLRYLPEFSLIDELGPVPHALDVRSDRAGTFRSGTSGAPWIIDRQAACQQFAGWESSAAGQNYTRGTGQSLATIFRWCRRRLASTYRQPLAGTELRLIREL